MADKRLNRKDKWNVVYGVLAFLVPVLLMGMIWAVHGITYDGKLTLLVYDARAQFAPFLASLRYVFEKGSQSFFDWSVSLGGNYLALYAYYLASPVNWITVLFPLTKIADAFYLLVLLKVGLCGLSFYGFLICGIGKGENRRPACVFFACCYALMSYNIMYGICIMWLDGVILLPILLLGIDRLFEGAKGGIFFGALFLLFLSNFYISYIVGIFAFLYLIATMIRRWNMDSKKVCIRATVRFFINTAMALAMSMPLLLPTLKCVLLGNDIRGDGMTASKLAYSFSMMDLLAQFLPQRFSGVANDALPMVFCGTIVGILTIVYFMQKHPLREKISLGFLILCIFAGFCFQGIDFVWHGFQYPDCYPYRYAFLLPAVMLMCAYKAYSRLNITKPNQQLIVCLTVGYTVAELFMNGSVLVGKIHDEYGYSTREAYERYIDTYEQLLEPIRQQQSFGRVDFERNLYTSNGPILFGVNGTTSFVTTYNHKVNVFLRQLGALDFSIITSAQGFTPVMDAVFAVQYRVTGDDLTDWYIKQNQETRGGNPNLYLNPYAMTLGYLIPNRTDTVESCLSGTVFENQDILLNCLGVEEEQIFWESEVTYREIVREADQTICRYVFKGERNREIYACLACDAETSGSQIQIVLDGERMAVVPVLESKRIFSLGTLESGGDHILEIIGPVDLEVQRILFAESDKEASLRAIQGLQHRQVALKVGDTCLVEGEFAAQTEEVLFTTIPYDDGLCIRIDGEIVQQNKQISETFAAVSVPPGRHTVTISYFPSGMKPGIMIAIAGACCVTVYYGFIGRKKQTE